MHALRLIDHVTWQGKCIDLGRITGGGGKKLEKKINESGYMRCVHGGR